jgi:hypothetical protein
MQTCICKSIDDTGLQASTNYPTVGLLFEPVQTNNTKCVLKGILIQASGLKIVKTCTFQRSPHMLDSTNICNPPILLWSWFVEGRFTILKEDPALYPHTCLGPVTYMGTLVTKWAKQCLAWVARFKQFVNIFNKHSHRQVLTEGHPYKKQKRMSSSTLVSLSQLAI